MSEDLPRERSRESRPTFIEVERAPPSEGNGGGGGRPPRAGGAGEGPPGGEEIRLSDLLAVLRRRKWTVLFTFLMVVGAAAAWTWWQDPVWRTSTLVRVEQSEQGPGAAMGSGEGLAALSMFRSGTELETEMRVVQTRPILEEVADELDLNFGLETPAALPRSEAFSHIDFDRSTPGRRYEIERVESGTARLTTLSPDTVGLTRTFAPGDTVAVPGGAFVLRADSVLAGGGLSTGFSGRLVVSTQPFSETVEALGQGLSVTRPDPDARLFQVATEGTDRFLVRSVLNRLTQAYIDRRQSVQNIQARSRVAFLETQNDRVERQLEEAEQALQEFRSEAEVVAPEAEAEIQVNRLADLRARRSELETERTALRNLLNKVESSTGEPDYRQLAAFPTFLKNQAIQNVLEQLTAAESKRAALLERRTENHPDVRALTRTIEKLESRLGEIATNYLDSLSDQIASLDATLSQFSEELEQVPSTELRYARLQRRTELLGQLHTQIQKQLQEARIAQNVEDPSVRVVESAVVPTEPVSPRPRLNLALGGVLGLMLGVGMAFVREYRDRSLHDEDDVERATGGLPILGRVPRMPEAEGGEQLRRDALVAAVDGQSPGSESYRTLRTNVRYSRGGEGARELVITSPGARDGKSTTAGNLAITFAQQGHRTLLVDADLRKAVQHKAFQVDRLPGLSDVMIGEVEVSDAVRETDQPNLYLLPAGQSPPNPSELLDSERMDRTLESVRGVFDAVVFDTPPALVVTDASVIGRRVEGVLLVVRADRTDRRGARESVERLEQVGADVLGVVFNDAGGSTYGYYGRYYHDYYGEEPGEKSGLKRLLPFG